MASLLSRDNIIRCQYFVNEIRINVINTRFHHNKTVQFKFECDINNPSEIVQFFGKLAETVPPADVKAIIFITPGNEFKSFVLGYYFRKRLIEFCQKHGIFCTFSTLDSLSMFDTLCKTDSIVENFEQVLFIRKQPHEMADGIVLVREDDYYRYLANIGPVEYYYTEEWKQDFLGVYNPRKVNIFQVSGDDMDFVKNMQYLFKDKFPDAYINGREPLIADEIVVDKVLHDMGERISPYNLHMGLNNYFSVYNGETIFEIERGRVLPLEEAAIIDVVEEKDYISLSTDAPHYYAQIERIQVATCKTKKVKVTLKVDAHSCYDFKVEPFYGVDLNEELVTSMNISQPSPANVRKAQIIFQEQTFSVAVIENGKERVLKNVDGFNNTPIYISFAEEKPFFGKRAMDMFEVKPEFVVYDLIKICSLVSVEDVKREKWGHQIFEENGNIMVTVQTVEGKAKSSVKFLLAMILKDAIQLVRKEGRGKFEEYEIIFDGFSPKRTLKNNFVEAAKLLKVNIVFG